MDTRYDPLASVWAPGLCPLGTIYPLCRPTLYLNLMCVVFWQSQTKVELLVLHMMCLCRV